MTKTDQILMAAGRASKDNPARTGVICLFCLTVQAWKDDPDQWGLPCYKPTHPDHKKVYVAVQHLLGRSVRVPLLERCGPNRVKMTDAGWARFHELAGGKKPTRRALADAGYVG